MTSNDNYAPPSRMWTRSKAPARRAGSGTIFNAVPRSKDPVLQYIRDAIHLYGYDQSSHVEAPAATINEWRNMFGLRVRECVAAFFPDLPVTDVSRILNVPRTTVQRAYGARTLSKQKRNVHEAARIVLLHLLVHAATIREVLTDMEKDVWTALLMSNDPRSGVDHHDFRPPKTAKADGFGRDERVLLKEAGYEIPKKPLPEIKHKKLRKRVKELMEGGRPLPPNAILPQIVPFRVLEMAGAKNVDNTNPYYNSNETERERELKAIAQQIKAEKRANGERLDSFGGRYAKRNPANKRPPRVVRTHRERKPA